MCQPLAWPPGPAGEGYIYIYYILVGCWQCQLSYIKSHMLACTLSTWLCWSHHGESGNLLLAEVIYSYYIWLIKPTHLFIFVYSHTSGGPSSGCSDSIGSWHKDGQKRYPSIGKEKDTKYSVLGLDRQTDGQHGILLLLICLLYIFMLRLLSSINLLNDTHAIIWLHVIKPLNNSLI